jgi:mannose-6-phosphate isomerase-like protein (cupin superfamily)
MRNLWVLFAVILLFHPREHAQTVVAQESSVKAVVLQKEEGELRTRRPRENFIPGKDFLLKISPKNNGSKHLVLGTEDIPPAGMIRKHRHHGQDEILLIQSGTAHIWLGGKEYDGQAGSVVFIPSETWVSLKNTGKEKLSVLFVFNEPGFEDTMRCGSVPSGQPALPISNDELKACAKLGHVEHEDEGANENKP